MIDVSIIIDLCLKVWSSFQNFASPVFNFLSTEIGVPYMDLSDIQLGVLPSFEVVYVSIIELSLGAGVLYFLGYTLVKWVLDIFF